MTRQRSEKPCIYSALHAVGLFLQTGSLHSPWLDYELPIHDEQSARDECNEYESPYGHA